MPATILTERLIEPSKMRGLGFYRMACLTGIFTGVAAGTTTAGHLIGIRNANAANLDFHIARILLRYWLVAGFTAAQEFRLDLLKLTAYTAAHTGSTGGANAALEARQSDQTAITDIVGRVAGTDALTAGTHTIGGLVTSLGGNELADGAAVVKSVRSDEIVSPDKHPVEILKPSQGLLLRNGILMGAGGTVRALLVVEGWLKDSSP